MFGPDLDNTRFNPVEDMLAADNVDQLAERWKITGAAVTSTPAVVDGVVYVADWDGNLQAYEADTGRTVWTSHLQDGSLIRRRGHRRLGVHRRRQGHGVRR